MGNEAFYIRVINPIGETMAIEELGSGTLKLTKSKEQIRYTQRADIEYESNQENVCVVWEPNTQFSKGIYEVQVYNKGFLAGTGSFQLK